jgi:hypothetical protein
MPTDLEPTTFESVLQNLEPLSTSDITDLVTLCLRQKEADAFLASITGLSTAAVRLLAARTLLRLRLPPMA